MTAAREIRIKVPDLAETGSWLHAILVIFSRIYLTFVACLLGLSMLPAATSLQPTVISSGSMSPLINAGDVVLAKPVPPHQLRKGMVVVMDSPTHPGRLLTHRIVSQPDSGTIRTRGDANGVTDSTPVSVDNVRGVGILLVPYVGKPLQWWHTQMWIPLAMWFVFTAAAVNFATQQVMPDPRDVLRSVRRELERLGQNKSLSGLPLPRNVLRLGPKREVKLPEVTEVRTAATTLMLGAAVVYLCVSAPERSAATFGALTGNSGNTFATNNDLTAPAVNRATLAASSGYLTGELRSSAQYRVYADVAADTGNPASGLSTVQAELPEIDSAGATVAMAASAQSIQGQSYNYYLDGRTSVSGLADGTVITETIIATDAAGNATRFDFTFTIDNSSPGVNGLTTTNKAGGTAGQPEEGDTFTVTFNDRIDPYSLAANWDGTGTQNLSVDIGSILSTDMTIKLPDGRNWLTLRNGSAWSSIGAISYGASGTPSRMSMSPDFKSITIQLGTASGTANTTAASNIAVTPTDAARDDAQNPGATATFNESDGDVDF